MPTDSIPTPISLAAKRRHVPPVRRRIAVFASYSDDGLLPPQVLPYLDGLRPFVDRIVVVTDNDLDQIEIDRLAPLADHVITGRHAEYDFGSYKRGIAWAREAGHLDEADDLILCNDSCFGPINSFGPMFAKMDARHLDFWGSTDSQQFHPHLQSFFVVLTRHVFQSQAFEDFFAGVTQQPNVQQVIMQYEIGLTKTLSEAGFVWGAMVENRLRAEHPNDATYQNIVEHPLKAIEMGLPLVKVKALLKTGANADGGGQLLAWLRQNAPAIYRSAMTNFRIAAFENAQKIAFSLIMPVYNRAWCMADAIRSVLAQTHTCFELIVVDDGSTDGTADLLTREFGDEIASGQLRYIKLDENVGVCTARNIGIAHARHDWIAYIDSDNQLRNNFLASVASSIIEHPKGDTFYGQILYRQRGVTVGRAFNREEILRGNYIDLGVFVHRKSLVYRFGGFDPALKRLVDWDLILRYTAHLPPVFIPRIFLDYTDDEDGQRSDRISVRESFVRARTAVQSKHSPRPTVSTVILSYNHQEYIVDAIESALSQRGDYTHEIILADDGSTDGTARIMARYAEKYPGSIRNISAGGNIGVAENYKHCFREAAGNFISILEGDDYWTDPNKNAIQADFLASHSEAGAVFSRIELFNMATGSRRALKRQDGLPALLTGADFARNEHLNLIVNFSSLMVRRDILAQVPDVLFKPRPSEISLAFYLDQFGKIGFIDKVMGTYRQNMSSVWTGAKPEDQLKQAIDARMSAMAVARPIYHRIIRQKIEDKQRQLAALGAKKLQKTQG